MFDGHPNFFNALGLVWEGGGREKEEGVREGEGRREEGRKEAEGWRTDRMDCCTPN